jgi:hypothetical protein
MRVELFGVPGSGKTTLAGLLREKYPGILVVDEGPLQACLYAWSKGVGEREVIDMMLPMIHRVPDWMPCVWVYTPPTVCLERCESRGKGKWSLELLRRGTDVGAMIRNKISDSRWRSVGWCNGDKEVGIRQLEGFLKLTE